MKIKLKRTAIIFTRTDEQTKEEFLKKASEYCMTGSKVNEILIKHFNKGGFKSLFE